MKRLALCFIILSLSSCKKHIPNDYLPGVKFSDSLNLSSFYEEKKELRNSDGQIIKIVTHDMNTLELAKAFIHKKNNEINLLFAPQIVPYFGEITKNSSCTSQIDISHKLTESPHEVSVYFDLTATERFIYGACIPEQETFKSQYLLLYCAQQKKLFEIKYFYDKKNPYMEQMAHCQ